MTAPPLHRKIYRTQPPSGRLTPASSPGGGAKGDVAFSEVESADGGGAKGVVAFEEGEIAEEGGAKGDVAFGEAESAEEAEPRKGKYIMKAYNIDSDKEENEDIEELHITITYKTIVIREDKSVMEELEEDIKASENGIMEELENGRKKE